MKLGINGIGRIGKLTVWNHISRKYFDELVVNTGRQVGTSIYDIAHYLERDSTYGMLHAYLYGHQARSVITDIDEKSGSMRIDGIRITFLRTHRNPCDIEWEANGVQVVVDTTGKFLDPTIPPDHPKGSVRGHFTAGAEKVIVSAPFKIKDKGRKMPEDAVTTVMGINHNAYDPKHHRIISHASCTTTCLAHMIKPILNHFGAKKLLSASMATIHAATGSQEVLDRLPESGKEDLRKNRSIMNNIILTTTGAARALTLVIPEMANVGLIAESVRVPVSTGSLIILVLNLQEDINGQPIRKDLINSIYKQAAALDPNGYIHYTDKQNVSVDIIGIPNAAAIIEGHETHTRTAEVTIDLSTVPGIDRKALTSFPEQRVRIPITQVVVYGWYDNEMGGYVHLLGERTISIAELIE
jgi:glyceraldehyde 3-phosphate dehydrogenase